MHSPSIDEHRTYDPGGASLDALPDADKKELQKPLNLSPFDPNFLSKLSNLIKGYDDPGEFARKIVGLSMEDLGICNQSLHSVTQPLTQDSFIKDKWKFSTALTNERQKQAKLILEKYGIWNGIGLYNRPNIKMPLKAEYKDASSIQMPYPMSPKKQTAYDKFIKDLEAHGVIEDAEVTRYCSPALILIKNRRPRLVIDFQKINKMSVKDIYPLPRQTDIFPQLQDAQYITLVDFAKAFCQLGIDPSDRDKTTFSTRHGGALGALSLLVPPSQSCPCRQEKGPK